MPSPTSQSDPSREHHRRSLLEILQAALEAVEGRRAVATRLACSPAPSEVTLVAIGKAAGAMALGAADAWGPAITGGLVIGKRGHLDRAGLLARRLESLVGGHPVPDARSLEAGRRLLALLAELPPGRELLFLLSGGASSLVEAPAAGLGLADLERATGWLLGSGLDITRMNRVRKALSRIKGGGLLRHLAGRPVRALLISDVPGDDPAVIGSGLLVPDKTLGDAASLHLPAWLAAAVSAGLAERASAPVFAAPPLEILARLDDAKAAAAARARDLGYSVRVHAPFLDGDAATAGRCLASILATEDPAVHVWGGETTVRLPPHPGRGGRNQHLALAAALSLQGREDLYLLAAGTDGTDGPTDDAGALVDGYTIERAAVHGLDATEHLNRADSGTLLECAGDLIHTGPTGTNVMDLVLGLRCGASGAPRVDHGQVGRNRPHPAE
jgi:hydroxypyruvate reductase